MAPAKRKKANAKLSDGANIVELPSSLKRMGQNLKRMPLAADQALFWPNYALSGGGTILHALLAGHQWLNSRQSAVDSGQ